MAHICKECGQEINAPSRMGLSKRQKECLDAIELFISRHDYSPTFAELAEVMGTAKSNVHGIINRLADRGWVRYIPSQSRSLMIIGKDE
ncbi:MAG TPA: hypothetical protein DCG72_08980 [Gammaproteobacteria bacterium]|jgi:Mn-dependent DtxR family transcriptional regulator|nr:hypothetical protein [Gammaproteobacteria bacterium]